MPRHIAIVAPPVPGHYDPLKVLARRLEARGYRVTFVHMPDTGALLDGFGFTAVGERTHGPGALRRYTDILARASRPTGFLAMIRATADITRMLLDELPGALERIGADAVIADATEPAGGLVARRLSFPWATSVTGLPLLREPGVPPPFVGWPYRDDKRAEHRNRSGYAIADLLSRPIARMLNRAGAAWGLDPREHGGFSPALQVAQCPPGLDFPRKELPASFHYTGPWREPAQSAPELPADRPLIYCSLGSLQGNRPTAFARMTEACAAIGARAVVAHGGRLSDADAARLLGNPVVRAHWDQPAVLPRCAAAILHAGFNTVLDALAAGVPMLVSPIAFEQPGTAARVAHAGAGVVLKRRPNARRIGAALEELLGGARYGENAGLLSAEIARLGGVEEAAARIDALFRRGAERASATTASPATDDARDDSRRSESSSAAT